MMINETMRARLRAMPVQKPKQPVSPGNFGEFFKHFPGHATLGTPGTVVAYGAGLFLIWKLLK